MVCAGVSALLLVLPGPVREPIASALRRTVLAPAVALQEKAELSRRAFLDHDDIMRVRDSIALQAFDATALNAENERLRQMLGLGNRLRWGFIPAEALHGRGVRDDANITLTAGARAGVERLSPVVAPEGLVGIVERVDPTMSHALLWTHPDFRASVMSEDGEAFGIVQAHGDNGPGRYLLEMRGVPFRMTLKEGSRIVTSGLGGVYPRGIPVGTVIGEVQTAESWARTYVIRPAVFPADVYSVMILTRDRAPQSLEHVWVTGVTPDSTLRRIIASGDSIALAASLAEARLQQARRDSIVRDSLARAGAQPGAPRVPGQQSLQPPSQPQTPPQGQQGQQQAPQQPSQQLPPATRPRAEQESVPPTPVTP